MRLQKIISILAYIICLSLTLSCDLGFDEDIEEETTTEYTFFSADKAVALSSFQCDIGSYLTAASAFPFFMQDGINTLKLGYTINGYRYWKNPDNSSTDVPSYFSLDSSGNVISLTSHPERAYFYISGFTPITYSVRFNSNDSYSNTEIQSLTYDKSEALRTNTFSRNGYKFKGWGDSESATNLAYSDGETVSNLAYIAGTVIDLYAIWWKSTIKISFDANGGTGSMSAITATVDSTSLPANTFTREGYTFSYWLSANGISYIDGATLTEGNWPNDDTTLYAQWSINTYTLTLDDSAGSGETSYQSFDWNVEQSITSSPFTRKGYDFLGWAESAGSSVVKYSDGDSLTLTSDKTLYAVWQEQTLTIYYNSNGGSGSMSSQTVKYSDLPKNLTSNAFTKAGYNFKGWAISSSTSSVTYSDSYAITQSNWLYGELNLSAVWEARGQVTVTSGSTASVSTTTSSTGITFYSADTGYSTYTWLVDNVMKQTSSSNTFEVNYADYSTGTHSIVCVCTTGTTVKYYSATLTIQ